MITKIVGSAGTGKTKLLEDICNTALDIYSPFEIAYISLARATINNMVDRFIIGKHKQRKEFKYFRTVHSLCYRLLAQQGMKIDLIEGHLQEFMEDTSIDLRNLAYLHEYIMTDNYIYNEFREYCNARANRTEIPQNSVATAWVSYKKTNNLLDYYDLIDLCIEKKLVPEEVKMLIVDEAQDLTKQQWDYINLIIPQCKEVYFAGDDDQSIYGFLGSSTLFNDIPSDYVYSQDTSYRIADNILQYALRFAKNRIKNRYNKIVKSVISGGEIKEIEIIDLEDYLLKHLNYNDDVMIIGRCGYLLNEDSEIKNILKRHNIDWHNPYSDDIRFNRLGRGVVYNAFNCIKKFMERKQVVKQELLDLVEIMPSYTFFKRGAKKALKDVNKDEFNLVDVVDYLTDEAKNMIMYEQEQSIDNFLKDEYKPYFSYWLNQNKEGNKTIKIGTIHSVKGGEANTVFLITEIPKRIEEILYTEQDLDNEYRVWYVGLTRAKNNLYIVKTNRRNIDL